MRTLIKKKHKRNCFALEAVERKDWKSAWAFPTDTTWANKWGNVTPSRRGEMLWIKVTCNDPSCPGEIWVDCFDFTRLLPNE